MDGHHLCADLAGCAADRAVMVDPGALRQLCLGAVQAAGLTAVGELFHAFPVARTGGDDGQARLSALPGGPHGGVTGMVLLAESHLAVHTWPERGEVTLDVYVCSLSGDRKAAARQVIEHLVAAFEPIQVQRRDWVRGLGR